MPQPTFLRDNECITEIHNDVFLKRPKIAAEAMECLRISSKIDDALEVIFMMVLSDTQVTTGAVNHHYKTIFGSFISFRMKAQLIADMMQSKSYPCAQQMSDFYGNHKAAFNKRNIIAHAKWCIYDVKRYDEGVVEGMSGYPPSYWVVKDFQKSKDLLNLALKETRNITDHTQIFVHNRVVENLEGLIEQGKYSLGQLSEKQMDYLRRLTKNATKLKTRHDE